MDNSNQSRLDVAIQGRVQGVGYRAFAREQAKRLGLTGWVRNEPNGGVRAVAEGPRPTLESYLQILERGPSMARVQRVIPYWSAASGEFDAFSVRYF